MTILKTIDPGTMPYGEALDLQMRLVDDVKSTDEERGYLVLLEHNPPVITLGRSAEENNILFDEATLKSRGFELHHISRGGDVTYHGPGQIVGYPIIRLDLRGRDIHQYLRNIEEIIIRTIAEFGVEGRRVEGLTGVWVGDEKIAATGVAVTRWVTYHGFALNVSPDLEHFNLIVPCGITDKGVTSLKKILGTPPDIQMVKTILAEKANEVLGFDGIEPLALDKLTTT